MKFKRLLAYTLVLTLLGGIITPVSHANLDQDLPAASAADDDLTALNTIQQDHAAMEADARVHLDALRATYPNLFDGFPSLESITQLATFHRIFSAWQRRFSPNMNIPADVVNIGFFETVLSLSNLHFKATTRNSLFLFALCSTEPPRTAMQGLINRGIPVPANVMTTLPYFVRNDIFIGMPRDQQNDLLTIIGHNRDDITQSPLAREFYASAHYLFNRLIQIANM